MLFEGTNVRIKTSAWTRVFPGKEYPYHSRRVVIEAGRHGCYADKYLLDWPMFWWFESDLEVLESDKAIQEARESLQTDMAKAQALIVSARSAIAALIEERDWLACQLSSAHSMMTSEDLSEEEKRHFDQVDKRCSKENLLEQVALLVQLVPPPNMDAELFSTILGCSIDQAEQALTEVEQILTDGV
jgi:hypothetical protein